jgi:hypothetical protein
MALQTESTGSCILSMFYFPLPRQFHTAIVENNKETHIRTAIWLFSVVPATFQPFVFPIAWAVIFF